MACLPTSQVRSTAGATSPGSRPHTLYVCGWGGALARYDGTRWSSIQSPTRNILTSLVCA